MLRPRNVAAVLLMSVLAFSSAAQCLCKPGRSMGEERQDCCAPSALETPLPTGVAVLQAASCCVEAWGPGVAERAEGRLLLVVVPAVPLARLDSVPSPEAASMVAPARISARAAPLLTPVLRI